MKLSDLGRVAIVPCLALICTPLPVPGVPDLSPVKSKEIAAHEPFVLAKDGVSAASICVMAPAPSPKLQKLVGELQTCIELTTGAKLPVLHGRIARPAIVLGACPEAKAQGLDGTEMPVDGFELKTSATCIHIVGNDAPVDAASGIVSNGTAWGAADFLERILGVRWYWALEADGRSIVKQPSMSIAPTWYADAPVFRHRDYWPEQFNPQVIFLRNGNSWPMQLRVHQPDWSQNAEYRKDRPEIYQMNPDGSRDFTTYCYTHPRTLATFMEQIAAHYAGKTKAAFVAGDTITVSPRDIGVSCRCPACSRLMDPTAGDLGSASPVLVDFVTRLANAVSEKYPGKSILFLAYMNYTRAPKGVKLPKNVFVEVCGMNGIATYKEPAIFAADQAPIDDWIAATGNKIQEWQYSCWPADRVLAPYQYPHVLQAFYRSNRDKSLGCFINSGVDNEWQRFHLTFYAWLKLLWNPEFPVDAALDEHCRRMYGPAAGTVREIVRIQCDGWEKSRWPGGRLTPKAVYEQSFPKATLLKLQELLARAKAEAAPDAPAAKRLAWFSGIFQAGFDEYATVMEGTGVQPMTAFKVATNPVVDGLLDEEDWKKADAVTLKKFDEYGTKKQIDAKYPTESKALFTLEGITFGFRMTEPSPDKLKREIKTNDNGMTYWDDCIELFLDPTGKNEGRFVQLIVNANGAVQAINNGLGSCKPEDVKTKSALGKDWWSMEIFVPYAVLDKTARGGTGAKWTIQITRNRMSDSAPNTPSLRENQKLNARFGGFNANAADFTTLNFRE